VILLSFSKGYNSDRKKRRNMREEKVGKERREINEEKGEEERD
jgi:hypothetical protein